MPKLPSSLALLAATLLATLAACDLPERTPTPPAIDIRPSAAVRFATERISPAVVQIDSVSEQFINGQLRPNRSTGTGFIIDKEGHILTNFHVAGRGKRIEVTLANQEHVRAKLIGSDHWTDLALLQLDPDELKSKNLTFEFAALGKSSEVTLGQPVMAVGTPYGLSRTVTMGIISQTDRAFAETNIDNYETGWFNNWIQTDAAINPGNSGGPLINLRGEVIGINTRGISEGNNLGFAIPIDTAKEVAAILLKDKKVARSYIGARLQPLQDLERFYELQSNRGVLVASVERDSPAFTAGLRAEDILLEVDGKPVTARFPEQLAPVRKIISDRAVGATIFLTIRRGISPSGTSATRPTTLPTSAPAAPPATAPRGETLTLSVTAEKLESIVTEERPIPAWGLTVRDLTRAYLRAQRLPIVEGVLITGMQTGSRADRASMQNGDIILRVNDKPVTSAQDLEAAVAEWEKAATPIGVDVARNRGQIPIVIRP